MLSNQDHVGTVADYVEIHACGVDIGGQLVVVPNRVPVDCSVVRASTVPAMLVLVFALCSLHVNWSEWILWWVSASVLQVFLCR